MPSQLAAIQLVAAGSPVGAPHSQQAADNHLGQVELAVGHSRLEVGSLGGTAWAEAQHANTRAVARVLGAHTVSVPQAWPLSNIEASEGGCLLQAPCSNRRPAPATSPMETRLASPLSRREGRS